MIFVHPDRTLFFAEAPEIASPDKTSAGPPFVRPETPDPSLALITADQFDNLIDSARKTFSCSPPAALFSQYKRKYSAILYPSFKREAAGKRGEKEGER